MFGEMRQDKFFEVARRKNEEVVKEDEERKKEELFAECVFLSDSDDGDDEPSQDTSNINYEQQLSHNSFNGMLTPILEEEDEYNSSTSCLSSNDDRKDQIMFGLKEN